jgi:hypothetical protein
MGIFSILILLVLAAAVVGGLWVDYQCNWKHKLTKREPRGFDVLPVQPQVPPPSESDHRS